MLVAFAGYEVWIGRGVGSWRVFERVPSEVNGAAFECYIVGVNVVVARQNGGRYAGSGQQNSRLQHEEGGG